MFCGSPHFWLVFFGEVGAFSFLPWFGCLNQTSLDVVEGFRYGFVATFDSSPNFPLALIGEIEAFQRTKRWLLCPRDFGCLVQISFDRWVVEV